MKNTVDSMLRAKKVYHFANNGHHNQFGLCDISVIIYPEMLNNSTYRMNTNIQEPQKANILRGTTCNFEKEKGGSDKIFFLQDRIVMTDLSNNEIDKIDLIEWIILKGAEV